MADNLNMMVMDVVRSRERDEVVSSEVGDAGEGGVGGESR